MATNLKQQISNSSHNPIMEGVRTVIVVIKVNPTTERGKGDQISIIIIEVLINLIQKIHSN